MAAKRLRIAISGSYGGLNLGDEAILQPIVQQLRGSLSAEITVFSRDPEHTLANHPVDRAIAIRQLTREEARREVERLDLLVLGGGGILFDDQLENFLREVVIADEVGVPCLVYAVSAGPLNEPAKRTLARNTLARVAALSVRDRQGQRLLEEIGIERDIQVTADPALLLEPEPLPDDVLRQEGIQDGRRLVGFSVREPGPAAPDISIEHYHALLANAADFLINRLDVDIVFVPMERRHMDLQHSHAVIARMEGARRASVLRGKYRPGEMLSLVGRFDFAVGMRLHFLIFSAVAGVPFVALPYASKVRGFLEDLELDVPPLQRVTTGSLIAHIDRSWDNQDSLREHVRTRLEPLRERARQTHRMLLDVLAGAEARGA